MLNYDLNSSKSNSLSILKNVQYPISISSSKIDVLFTPLDFYKTLISLTRKSTIRIGISTLYFGDDPFAMNLVSEIGTRLSEFPQLPVTIVADLNRSMRQGKTVYARPLEQLEGVKFDQDKFYPNVDIKYFNCTNNISAFNLNQLNEILGVQHTKIIVFDDTVIITGANLSEEYFTTRFDRWIKIQDKELADYCYAILKSIADVSMRVNSSIAVKYTRDIMLNNANKLGSILESRIKLTTINMLSYRMDIRKALLYDKSNISGRLIYDQEYLGTINQNKYITSNEEVFDHKHENNSDLNKLEFNLDIQSYLKIINDIYDQLGKDINYKNINPTIFEYYTDKQLLYDYKKHYLKNNSKIESNENIIIFGLLNYSKIGINNSFSMIQYVLNEIKHHEFDKIIIQSGYLNFPYKIYKILMEINKNKPVSLYSSSVYANSFFKSKNIIKRSIAKTYSYIFYTYYKNKFESNQFQFIPDNLQLNDNMYPVTFHSKGLYIYNSDKIDISIGGSSNYNMRGFERDIEYDYFIDSSNDKYFSESLKQYNQFVQSNSSKSKDKKDFNYNVFNVIFYKFIKNLL